MTILVMEKRHFPREVTSKLGEHDEFLDHQKLWRLSNKDKYVMIEMEFPTITPIAPLDYNEIISIC